MGLFSMPVVPKGNLVTTIVVDGVKYVPESTPRVGIAVTVRDREDATRKCLEAIRTHTDPSVPVVIVDDASKVPHPEATYRFGTNVGIPAAKNKCLELLMDLGCDYLVLLDNDALPCRDDWLDVFVNALKLHPHVSCQFKDLTISTQLGDIECLYDDGVIEAWTGQRGYVLAYTRQVIEQVGGFDPVYGKGLYEHMDLANRIHAAGLTTFRYASPKDSHLYVESLDQSKSVQRTPLDGRTELVKRNAEIHNERRYSGFCEYVEFREQRDVVLTCLYTGKPDPQRGSRLAADGLLLKTLVDSCKGLNVSVLFDEPFEADPRVEYAHMPNVVNVYFQRWINALAWLESHPEVRNVLVCDGTDVEVLQPGLLFDSVEPGVLTVGSEFQIVGCDWMVKNHTHPKIAEWLAANNRRQLLNAGVVMGDRQTVIEFIREMISVWELLEIDRFNKKQNVSQVGDMAVFNYVAYTKFGDRLNYGPHVTTRFKANEKNDFSLVRHK